MCVQVEVIQRDRFVEIDPVIWYAAPAILQLPTQYFGYLRRDLDTIGYSNWVATLTADPNNFRHMIFGFVFSDEYRHRFGPYEGRDPEFMKALLLTALIMAGAIVPTMAQKKSALFGDIVIGELTGKDEAAREITIKYPGKEGSEIFSGFLADEYKFKSHVLQGRP